MVLASFLWVVNFPLHHHGKLLREGTLVEVASLSQHCLIGTTGLLPPWNQGYALLSRNPFLVHGSLPLGHTCLLINSFWFSFLDQSPSQHCTVPLVVWEVLS